MKSQKKSGFTLVELMIFFVFVSLLLAAAAPMITKRVKDLPRRFNHGMYMCYRDTDGTLTQKFYNSTRELTEESGTVTQCTFTPPKKAGLFKVELFGAGAGGYTYHHHEDSEPPKTGQYNPDGGYSGNAPEPTDDDIRNAYNGKTIDAFVFEGNGGDAGVISFTYYHPLNSYCTGVPYCTPYPKEPTPPKEPDLEDPSYYNPGDPPSPPSGAPAAPGEGATQEQLDAYNKAMEEWQKSDAYSDYLDALADYNDAYAEYLDYVNYYDSVWTEYQDKYENTYLPELQAWKKSNSCSAVSYRTGVASGEIYNKFSSRPNIYGTRSTLTEGDVSTIDGICSKNGVGVYAETGSSSSSSLLGGSHSGGRGSTLSYNYGISIPDGESAYGFLEEAFKKIQVGSCEKTGCGTFTQNVFPKSGERGADCYGGDMTHGGKLPPDAVVDENGKTQYDGKDIDRIAAIKTYEGEIIPGSFITGAKAGSASGGAGMITEKPATPGEPTSGNVLPNENGVFAPTLYVTAQTNDRTWRVGNGGGNGAALITNVATLSGNCVFSVPRGGGPININSDLSLSADVGALTTVMSCNNGKFVLRADGGSSPGDKYTEGMFDAYTQGGAVYNLIGESGGNSLYKSKNPFNKYNKPTIQFGKGGNPSSVSDPCTDWYGSISHTILDESSGYSIDPSCDPEVLEEATRTGAGAGIGGAVFISW